MYLLKNSKTNEYFCEFAEHFPLTTTDVNEAADFHTPFDAEQLKVHLPDAYTVIPKPVKTKTT